jgi:hypothetical protein
MRAIVEMILAVALIALGWEQPLKESVPWLADKAHKTVDQPQSSSLNSRPSPTIPGSWMWDPNRQSILDTPRPKASATVNSSLLDPNHRTSLDPPTKDRPTPH